MMKFVSSLQFSTQTNPFSLSLISPLDSPGVILSFETQDLDESHIKHLQFQLSFQSIHESRICLLNYDIDQLVFLTRFFQHLQLIHHFAQVSLFL